MRRPARQLRDRDAQGIGDRQRRRQERLLLAGLVPADLPGINAGGLGEFALRHAEFGTALTDDLGHLHGFMMPDELVLDKRTN